MRILAIDPANVESAYVLLTTDFEIIDKGKVPNEEMIALIDSFEFDFLAVEMIASYGMAVGKTVFETCVWIGRFIERSRLKTIPHEFVYRKDVKMHLCGSMRAKDANIRQALIDRFGIVGVKANPGYFYGFKVDIWAAMAVGTYWIDEFSNQFKSL